MKENKGITLIALVITIIVMLILAGVTINIAVNGGLFKQAQSAADLTNQAAQKEQETINNVLDEMSNYVNGGGSTTPTLKSDGSWDGTVNTPQLVSGMTAVAWDGSGNEITPTKNSDWYDYTSSKWANAKTADGSYWVWIPRYAYEITGGIGTSTAGTIKVAFLQGTTNTDASNNTISTTYPTVTGGAMQAYVVHPAFCTNLANGGWSSDLAGFWVAKFEAGYAGGGKTDGNNKVTPVDTGIEYTGTVVSPNYYGTVTTGSTHMYYPVFMPSSYSYNNINISSIYNLSRNLTKAGNPYGLSSATDSHMMKNSEWGAAAYLSWSSYGTNGTEIAVNNYSINSTVPTIYAVTGVSTGSTSAGVTTIADTTAIPASNKWNGTNGVKNSSTGNITGIYDLSGACWEYTAGYILNGNTTLTIYGTGIPGVSTTVNANPSSAISTKYVAAYPYNSSSDGYTNNLTQYNSLKSSTYGFGDSILEISSNASTTSSWNSDFSYFPNTTAPFFIRGGHYDGWANAGVFAFLGNDGSAIIHHGFRAALVP